MTGRSSSIFGSVLFIFYCAAVGVYLLLRPWSFASSHAGVSGSGFFRGFVSGLGLLHIGAGVADLRILSRAMAREPAADSGPETG